MKKETVHVYDFIDYPSSFGPGRITDMALQLRLGVLSQWRFGAASTDSAFIVFIPQGLTGPCGAGIYQ